jgi:hypothetical protein
MKIDDDKMLLHIMLCRLNEPEKARMADVDG